MSTAGHSNRAQRIQAPVESPFTLLAQAVIPHAVSSAAGLLEAIQSFCAQPSTIPPKASAHNLWLHTDVELQLVFAH